MKAKIGTVLRVLVTVVVIALIAWFSREKLGEALQILRTEVQIPYFALAFAIYLVSIGIISQRLHFALEVKKIKWDFLNTLYVSSVGIFFNLILPSAIGGDAVKAVYLAKHARTKADVFSCLVIDRLSGLCVILFLAFLSAASIRETWNPVPAWLGWSSIGMLFLAGVAVFMRPEWIPFIFSKMRFLPHRFQEKLNLFYDSLSGFFHDRPFLIRSLLCSIVAQSLFITSFYFVGKSLDAPIPYSRFFMMVPMMTILSMVPSIGGAGPREAGALILFKMYMPDERAWAMTLLIDILIYWVGFLGGFWYLAKSILEGHKRKAPSS